MDLIKESKLIGKKTSRELQDTQNMEYQYLGAMAPDLTTIPLYEYENWGQGKQNLCRWLPCVLLLQMEWGPSQYLRPKNFLIMLHWQEVLPTCNHRHQPISWPKLLLNLELQKVNCFVESIASALSLKLGCDFLGGPGPTKASVQRSKLWQVFYQQPTSVTYILMWAIRLLLMRHLRDKRIMFAAQAMVEVQLN